jgi:acyl-CoA synthetase (AMP-forming)/AMP-acid ligase II
MMPLSTADRTSVALLRRRAHSAPDRRAFLFLSDGEHASASLTYGELDARCRAVAAHLQAAGLAGERVLLLYPSGLEFIVGFLGCLYAGAVAVPLYLPESPQAAERIAAIASDAQAAAALTTAAGAAILNRFEALAGLGPVLTPHEAGPEAAPAWTPVDPAPEALAFLQYTSGSTGAPKGVMVSHANIMGNQAAIQAAARQGPEAVFLSWLPLYHDMGLMGMVMQPLYVGATCVLMPPMAFLRRPARWLRAIARYGATISGGPNFAFDLCLTRVAPEDRAGLDLSRWQVAYSGAEPVSADTLARFTEAFAPNGLRPTALYPCYGLAEATAFFTGGALGAAPSIAHVAPEALTEGHAAPDAHGRALVGCGFPYAGHRMLVVDAATRRACPERTVGEIWLSGPSVAGGYWNRPEATRATFGFALSGGEEVEGAEATWLRTGDMGFVHDGQLVVCGRSKDLVIIRGRNHHPQDLERTVRDCHPALGPGEGAAFTLEDDGGEARLCLVHELKPAARDQAPEVLMAIRQAVAAAHGLRPAVVALIKWGTLPKTSSGKVQRAACREAYLAGTLDLLALEGRVGAASPAVSPVGGS